MKGIVWFIMLAVVGITTACSSVKEVPVITERIDTTRIERAVTEAQLQKIINSIKQTSTKTDSVIVRDSIIVVVNQQGEVVSKERYRDSDKSHSDSEILTQMQLRYDSLATSLQSKYEQLLSSQQDKVVEVEKPKSTWDKIKDVMGDIFIGIISASLILLIIYLVKKFKK